MTGINPMAKSKTVECSNCGSEVPITDSLCRYCNTPIETGHKLTKGEEEKLTAVINAMEEALVAAESLNWVSGVSFLGISIISVGLFLLYYWLLDSTIVLILLTVFTIAALFLFLGFVISYTDNLTYRKLYRGDVKERINEYLENQGFSRHQFDVLAEKVLKDDAVLRRFLFKN